MKLYRMEEAQVVPVPLATAWAFFSDPHNLEIITPPRLHLVVSGEVSRDLYPGQLISYRVSPFGKLRAAWLTEITHVIEERLFVDEQRFGPYRFWHHQHHFREIEGGTELRDIVHYILPYGLAGRTAARLVQRQLRAIFDYRRQVIATRFGNPDR